MMTEEGSKNYQIQQMERDELLRTSWMTTTSEHDETVNQTWSGSVAGLGHYRSQTFLLLRETEDVFLPKSSLPKRSDQKYGLNIRHVLVELTARGNIFLR